MAVSMRERPVLRGKDAERFLAEEKRVDECRAEMLKKIEQGQEIGVKGKRVFRLCVTK